MSRLLILECIPQYLNKSNHFLLWHFYFIYNIYIYISQESLQNKLIYLEARAVPWSYIIFISTPPSMLGCVMRGQPGLKLPSR